MYIVTNAGRITFCYVFIDHQQKCLCHLALLNKERASWGSLWVDVCVTIFF